jgi:hypothetical protein
MYIGTSKCMNIIAGAASMLEIVSKSEKQAVKHHGKGRKCKRTLAKQDEQQKGHQGASQARG